MVYQVAVPIATAVGEFAAPYLIKEATKLGIKKFIQTYGSTAFQAISTGVVGGMIEQVAEPVDLQKEKLFGIPVSRITGQEQVYSDIEEPTKVKPLEYIPEIHGGKPLPPIEQEYFPAKTEVEPVQEGFKKPEKIEPLKGLEIPPQEIKIPPGIQKAEPLGTDILTKDKPKDITKQTKDLVTKEPEFGALTETEKQTAIALKGDKPDYYSRVVRAISEAEGDKNVIKTKNDWLGYINAQGVKKAEMDYLGLTDFLKGKDKITKQKLLEYTKEKDLSSRITTTLIPKKDMGQLKYPEYSLTGRYDTKVYVMQYDVTKDKEGKYLPHDFPIEYHAPAIHVGKEQYGRNTFGTIRVEEGYTLDPDLKNITKIDKQNIEALKKASIGVEFQSDMIQKGQKEGFKKAWKIYKGDEITKEFIETNYKDRYRLTENVTEFDKLNKNTSLLHTKELDRSGNETGKWVPIKRLIKDHYYVFDKTGLVLGQNLITKSKEEAEEVIKNYAPPEFPIKDSRKIAELMLTELINQAILAGNDSIAISNGQVLVDRYYQADDKTKEGFKFWHDKILLGELRKIDKKILNETGINESLITEHILGTTVKTEKEDYMANFLEGTRDWVNEATEQGYSLKKMTKEELKTFLNLGSSIRMHTTKNNQTIPDHASIVTNVGNAQGIDNMRGYIEEPEMMTEYDDDPYFDELETGEKRSENFYIWMDANGKVKFELPIVSADDADIYMTDETRDTETSAYVEGLSEDFTERTYLEYIISNRQKIEDEAVDLKRPREKHKLFKLKLPKKYQKKILSESQKFTKKVDEQTQRLVA